MAEQTRMETIKVEGSQLIDQIKRLVHEGNVRRIIIKQEDRTVAEFPLTIGVIGVVLAPMFAAVGALATLLTDCTIEVERFDDAPVGIAYPVTNGHKDEVPPTVGPRTP
jgi:Domain of unknown function (DUF4342)